MTANPDPMQLLECLQRMMEELGSPDLTLVRSDELRPRISGLLESLRSIAAQPAQPPCR